MPFTATQGREMWPYRGELTVMLGPPAHPEQRAAFDAYQIAVAPPPIG